MAKLKSYNAKQVSIVYAGLILSGYAEGDFCTVEMSEADWTHHVGADGEECRARTNNGSAKVTVKLSQYSESNARLADLRKADLSAGTGVSAFGVLDKSGKSIHASDQAYISKAPAATYSKEPGDREWEFMLSNAEHYVGGN